LGRLIKTISVQKLVKLLVDKPPLRHELMHLELRSVAQLVDKVRHHKQLYSDPRNSLFRAQFIARRNISEIQSSEEMEINSQIDEIHNKIVCEIAMRKIKNSWIVFLGLGCSQPEDHHEFKLKSLHERLEKY